MQWQGLSAFRKTPFSLQRLPLTVRQRTYSGASLSPRSKVGFLPPLVGINIFLASFRLRRRVLEVCLAVPFDACRGRSARDYVRNLADDNAS
jgi:hypothetical protein